MLNQPVKLTKPEIVMGFVALVVTGIAAALVFAFAAVVYVGLPVGALYLMYAAAQWLLAH